MSAVTIYFLFLFYAVANARDLAQVEIDCLDETNFGKENLETLFDDNGSVEVGNRKKAIFIACLARRTGSCTDDVLHAETVEKTFVNLIAPILNIDLEGKSELVHATTERCKDSKGKTCEAIMIKFHNCIVKPFFP